MNESASIPSLLALLRNYPDGASAAELRRIAGSSMSPRTFQRRLEQMVASGLLRKTGQTRDRRYLLVSPPAGEALPQGRPGAGRVEADLEVYVPLSLEGKELRDLVRGPLTIRTPVGYKRAFLDAYRPNQTFYLPESLRSRLFTRGLPSRPDRPAGTYAREILQRLLIDLSWNSSRLEGNTYSILDTQRLIEEGLAAEGKDARDAQMILNHKAAIEFLVEEAEEIGLNSHTLRNLHALLSENLLGDPADGGRLREKSVGIHGTTYLPLEVPQLIEECFLQILHTAEAVQDPFEQSFFLTVHLPYLQPFMDVNKRTARLAANIPFIRHNLCPLSYVDVPVEAYTDGLLGVYELNRVEILRDVFVWAYERSCARYSAIRESMGEPDLFKLHHRTAIKEAVAEVVRSAADAKIGGEMIRRYAKANLPDEDWIRFRAVVEAELAGLHEGNFARYRLRPSEFSAWRARWNG